jgi:hypothetical protein
MVSTPRKARLAPAALVLAALVVAITVGGCRCLAPVVNPSPGLRWWLFANFGAGKMCPELLKRGMGLRMQDGGPAVGRFFPNSCRIEVNDEQKTVTVFFGGEGYAFLPVTKRVTFNAQGAVEYRPDFHIAEDDLYVWGRVNRVVHGPTFNIASVENPIANAATQLTPLGQVANLFGNQIMAGELTRGFTVLQNLDTDTKTFGLGIIQPPGKPRTPYDLSEDDVLTYANETIEVQTHQRDFLGPFEIVDTDQHLQLRLFLNGPPVEALVVARQTGDPWRAAYQQGGLPTPPPGPILAGSALQPGIEARPVFKLPPGQYYVVIDNTATAGNINPAGGLLDLAGAGPVARISYAVQLVER